MRESNLARLFVTLGGVIVILLMAALVGPYFVDWNGYRADFEREAGAILGRKVTVRGQAHARLLPFPSLSFSDVSVGGGSDIEPTMTVETFSMDAELAPFMRGELLIFDMRMEKPKVVISIGNDGAIDWLTRPKSPVDASRVALEKLTVTNGSVEVRHGPSGRTHLLSEINSVASAKALTGPWRMDGSLRADGAKTTFTASTGTVGDAGRMHLRVRAEPAPLALSVDADGDVEASPRGLRYAGTFKAFEVADKPAMQSNGNPAAQAAPPRYRVSGTFGLDSAALDIKSFRLETGPLRDPYTADGKALLGFGPQPRFSVEATGAQVQFDDTLGDGKNSALRFGDRLDALRLALGALPKPSMPGHVKVDLPAVVVGDTTIRDVRLEAEPEEGGWAIASAAATLPGRTTLEADGFLATADKLGFKGKLLLAIAQPSGFAAWVSRDVDDAIRKLPAAGFSAKVDLTERRQLFSDLELVLGGAHFRGSIDSREPGNVRRSTTVTLDGGALDVSGLAAFASLFVSDAGARRFAQSDFDFSIKAGPVSGGGFTADSVDTSMRLKPHSLEIDRLSIGGLSGANISATGTIRDYPTYPSGKLEASVVAADLEPLMTLAASNAPTIPGLGELARRIRSSPDLLADAELKFVAATADAKPGIVELSLDGKAGGNTVQGRYVSNLEASSNDLVTLSFTMHSDDATAALALAGLPTLPLGLVGAGETEIQAKGTVADGLLVSASFKSDTASASFVGTADTDEKGPALKGKLALDTEDIEPWLMTTGSSWPGMGTGLPFTLAADADYAAGLLVLQHVDASVAEAAVGGDVNIDVKGGRPRVTGALALDELAFDPLAAMVAGDGALGDNDAPFAQMSQAPFSANVDVSAATLSAGPSLVARNATMTLRVEPDGLRVEDLKSTLYGGMLTGRFEIRNNGGTGLIAGQASLAGANLADIPVTSALTGRLDSSVTFSGTGKSVAGMIAGLSGSGRASVAGIEIKGIASDALPTLLAKADAAGRDIDTGKVAAFAGDVVGAGLFEAGNADIAFSIAGGVLRAPPVTLSNREASLTADLRAGLATDEINASGAVTYAAGEAALAGSEPMVNFALSGPIEAPSLRFDSEPLAQFLTQRSLEREQQRVEAMQAVLLEKQRLRREVRYYASLQAERDRLAEEARQKAEAEARQRAEVEAAAAQAAAEQAQAEAARRSKAAADAKRREDEAGATTSGPDIQRMPLPPVSGDNGAAGSVAPM